MTAIMVRVTGYASQGQGSRGLRSVGRRMGLRYSGPRGDYPVYQCRADQQQHGGPRRQEVRALPVDAVVESLAPPGCARVGPSVSPAARHPGRSPGSFGEGPRVRGLTAGGRRIRTLGPRKGAS